MKQNVKKLIDLVIAFIREENLLLQKDKLKNLIDFVRSPNLDLVSNQEGNMIITVCMNVKYLATMQDSIMMVYESLMELSIQDDLKLQDVEDLLTQHVEQWIQ